MTDIVEAPSFVSVEKADAVCADCSTAHSDEPDRKWMTITSLHREAIWLDDIDLAKPLVLCSVDCAIAYFTRVIRLVVAEEALLA